MKATLVSAIFALLFTASPDFAQNSGDKPDRTALARAAQGNPTNVAAWTAYAEFLDRYGDPGARDAYVKLAAALRNSGDSSKIAAVNHRIALFDLMSGDAGAARVLGRTPATNGTAAQPWPTT